MGASTVIPMVAPLTRPMSEGIVQTIAVIPKPARVRRYNIDRNHAERIRAAFHKPAKPNVITRVKTGLSRIAPEDITRNNQANDEMRKQYAKVLNSNSENLNNSLNSDMGSTNINIDFTPKVYPIRCSEVGGQYPDLFRITPAYDIKYSGESWSKLTTGLITCPENNIYKRIKRWVAEDKYITYCDFRDKTAALIALTILILTFVITIWQLKTDSVVEYRYSETNETNKTLTKLSNQFAYVKMVLSGIASVIIMWNIFKRTTVPTHPREIKDFITAELESLQELEPIKKISAL